MSVLNEIQEPTYFETEKKPPQRVNCVIQDMSWPRSKG